MIFLCFLVLALAAAVLYAVLAAPVTVWGVAGVFALAYLAANVLLVLLFGLGSLRLKRLAPGEGIEKQDAVSRAFCTVGARWLCGWAGVRPQLTGLEKLPDTPFLFVCNHRSMFDPIIVMGWMDRYNISFVSKPSNLRIPIVGRTVRHVGFLPIDRENNREALKTILLAADYLRRGLCSIGIYPEGTRSKTGELGPFHAGSFKIAQKAGVPLVIACVSGTEQVKKHLPFRTTKVYLEILETVEAGRVRAMGTQELAEEARDRIRRRLAEREA